MRFDSAKFISSRISTKREEKLFIAPFTLKIHDNCFPTYGISGAVFGFIGGDKAVNKIIIFRSGDISSLIYVVKSLFF